jgi:dihydrodipicolinate synthase/N-acetylneuraminate lyase
MSRVPGPGIRGTLAAALTPLAEGGDALDLDAIPSLVDFLAAGGVDGVLALGTTGEGIALDPAERRAVAEAFVEACAGRLDVAVHCGAQTTAATVALAAHAAEAGAAAVAVIAPPYFPLDDREQLAHLRAAAEACAPLPFYVYEFAARSGYAISPTVLGRLREAAPSFRGLKVSDAPFERFSPYLIEGLDVFVGPEALIADGIAGGAVGAVSALATAFPEEVAAAVRDPTPARSARLAELRAAVQACPMPAAVKAIARRRGVPVREDVRRPLRGLDDGEREALFAAVVRVVGA